MAHSGILRPVEFEVSMGDRLHLGRPTGPGLIDCGPGTAPTRQGSLRDFASLRDVLARLRRPCDVSCDRYQPRSTSVLSSVARDPRANGRKIAVMSGSWRYDPTVI
jgi:hypothetical protein